MAFCHNSIEDVIFRSRIRTAADDATKSMSFDDIGIENFIQSICEMADEYDQKCAGLF